MTIESAIAVLTSLLGEAVTTSKSDRALHGRSESYFDEMPPDAVVYPGSTDDVAALMRVCYDHDCPVIGFGAGTSLEAQTSALRGGIAVDFSKMARVVELRAEDMIAGVQPGITRQALNDDLRATGLMFPVDPGANASVGGWRQLGHRGPLRCAMARCATMFWGLRSSSPMGRSFAPAQQRRNHRPDMI